MGHLGHRYGVIEPEVGMETEYRGYTVIPVWLSCSLPGSVDVQLPEGDLKASQV